MAVESWHTDEVVAKNHLSKNPKPPLALAFLVILSLASGFLGGWIGANNRLESPNQSVQANQRVVSSESQLINDLVKKVSPSVVSIDVTSSGSQIDAFGFSRQTQQESAGTGFIISGKGIVITNRHVVPNGSNKVSITLSDGTRLTDVSVIGRTSDSDPLDVAFLKINNAKGKKLKALTLGDSSKVQVGDKVVAIGNALGQFQNTVTSGIISGYGRSVQAGDGTSSSTETLQDLFQTDAAINEGNSGGPLMDISGNVVGINTAIAGGNAQNIGFSIPINDVKGLINGVLTKGKLIRPYLGIRYVSLTDDIASQYNLNTKRGAYIIPSQGSQSSVLAGSPAEKAGLKEGDIITKVGGDAIDQNNSLTSLLSKYNVGDKVDLTIIRDGKNITVSATLAAAPNN
ncbi:MAG: S1C family serine protease [Candidatus Saccharimonadales bacterium]